jgi:hypothetical protein
MGAKLCYQLPTNNTQQRYKLKVLIIDIFFFNKIIIQSQRPKKYLFVTLFLVKLNTISGKFT